MSKANFPPDSHQPNPEARHCREQAHSWRLAVVCPNPALDVTAVAPANEPGDTIAGADISIRAGGKGTNTACVAADLGASVTLVAPLGGDAGIGFEHMLDSRLSLKRIAVSGPTRLCLTLRTPNGISEIRGRGPVIKDGDWRAFTEASQDAAMVADAVVVSGSFPPGIAASRVAELVSTLRCTRVYFDTSGAHLTTAAGLADLTIAPNFDELCALAGEVHAPNMSRPSDRSRHAARIVAKLRTRGGARILATLGEAGAGLFCGHRWCVAVPPSVKGNPVGAGDAALAAFVGAEVLGLPPEQALKRAVAAGTAAVAQPVAGRVDPRAVESIEQQVSLLETVPEHSGPAAGKDAED